MTQDEKFVESVGDGCLQVVFGAMVFWTVVGFFFLLASKGCKAVFS